MSIAVTHSLQVPGLNNFFSGKFLTNNDPEFYRISRELLNNPFGTGPTIAGTLGPQSRNGENKSPISSRVLDSLSKGRMFSRPNLYRVEFNISESVGTAGTDRFISRLKNNFQNRMLAAGNDPTSNESLNLFGFNCSSIEIPGSNITTSELRYNNQHTRKYPTTLNYPDVTATFYASEDMREYAFLKAWQDSIIDPKTHAIGYQNEYSKLMTVYMLTRENNSDIYKFEVTNAYPVNLASVPLSYASNDQITQVSCVFSWF